MDAEFRFAELEFREDAPRQLSGTVVRYGDTAKLPFGSERFEPGAFGTANQLDAILNVQHDRTRPLARTGGGGLSVEDSTDALRMVAELPQTREADDVLALVRAGVLRGLSLEFVAQRERMEGRIRVISKARLRGVAVVDRPAYPESAVAARADNGRRRRRIWL